MLLNYKGAFYKLAIFVLIWFSPSFLQAQKYNPGNLSTGDHFIRHKVLPNQTFKSIGELYNVSAEALSAYNYIENYAGPVIALYLKVPLTSRNFGKTSVAKPNQVMTPVYKVKGYAEMLVRIKNDQSKTMQEPALAWSNAGLRSRSGKELPVIGYLYTNKKFASVLETITPAPPVKNASANKPEMALKKKDTAAGTSDVAIIEPGAKSPIQSTDTARKAMHERALVINKPVIGRNHRIIHTPSERKLYPFIILLISANVLLIIAIFTYLAIKKRTTFLHIKWMKV